MPETGHIYKITNPNGKIYIGKTVDIKRRISKYRSGCHPGQILIYNSIKKYGWETHTLDIKEQEIYLTTIYN